MHTCKSLYILLHMGPLVMANTKQPNFLSPWPWLGCQQCDLSYPPSWSTAHQCTGSRSQTLSHALGRDCSAHMCVCERGEGGGCSAWGGREGGQRMIVYAAHLGEFDGLGFGVVLVSARDEGAEEDVKLCSGVSIHCSSNGPHQREEKQTLQP